MASCAALGSRSGQLLATGSSDGLLRVWRLGRETALGELAGPRGGVECAAFDPAEHLLLSGSEGGAVALFDLPGMRLARKMRGHAAAAKTVGFHPGNPAVLVSGGADAAVRLWDARSGREYVSYKGHDGAVTAVAFSPDGKWLATGDDGGTARLWDLAAGKLIAALPPQRLSASRLRRVGGGSAAARAGASTSALRSLAFHPSELLLTGAGDDRSVRCWDVAGAGAGAGARCAGDVQLRVQGAASGGVAGGRISETRPVVWTGFLAAGTVAAACPEAAHADGTEVLLSVTSNAVRAWGLEPLGGAGSASSSAPGERGGASPAQRSGVASPSAAGSGDGAPADELWAPVRSLGVERAALGDVASVFVGAGTSPTGPEFVSASLERHGSVRVVAGRLGATFWRSQVAHADGTASPAESRAASRRRRAERSSGRSGSPESPQFSVSTASEAMRRRAAALAGAARPSPSRRGRVRTTSPTAAASSKAGAPSDPAGGRRRSPVALPSPRPPPAEVGAAASQLSGPGVVDSLARRRHRRHRHDTSDSSLGDAGGDGAATPPAHPAGHRQATTSVERAFPRAGAASHRPRSSAGHAADAAADRAAAPLQARSRPQADSLAPAPRGPTGGQRKRAGRLSGAPSAERGPDSSRGGGADSRSAAGGPAARRKASPPLQHALRSGPLLPCQRHRPEGFNLADFLPGRPGLALVAGGDQQQARRSPSRAGTDAALAGSGAADGVLRSARAGAGAAVEALRSRLAVARVVAARWRAGDAPGAIKHALLSRDGQVAQAACSRANLQLAGLSMAEANQLLAEALRTAGFTVDDSAGRHGRVKRPSSAAAVGGGALPVWPRHCVACLSLQASEMFGTFAQQTLAAEAAGDGGRTLAEEERADRSRSLLLLLRGCREALSDASGGRNSQAETATRNQALLALDRVLMRGR